MTNIPTGLDQVMAEMRRSVSTITIPQHTYSIPRIALPKLPRMPTIEERHAYESSGALLSRLIVRVRAWRAKCPKDAQPVIWAVLPNGTVINVSSLGDEGHNGVVITGTLGEKEDECMFLAHQSSLGLLCFIQKTREEKKRYRIGFSVAGKETEE